MNPIPIAMYKSLNEVTCTFCHYYIIQWLSYGLHAYNYVMLVLHVNAIKLSLWGALITQDRHFIVGCLIKTMLRFISFL